jgi:histidine phosphotransferase ChpT
LSELLALLDGQVAGGRARVELAAGAALRPDTVLAAPLAQLVLNAVLLGGEALPRGGTVVLAGDPAQTLAVCPEGPSAAWPPSVAAAIAAGGLDPAMPVEARSVRAPVLAALAAELRIPLTLALSGPEATGPAPLLIGPAPAAAC